MSIPKIAPFLMFSGRAEEAMNYYTSVFDNSEILSVRRFGPNEAGAEGSVLHAMIWRCSAASWPRRSYRLV